MAPNDMTLPSGTKVTEDLLPLAKQLGVDPRDGRLMLLIEDMARHESLPVRWMSKYDASAKRWVYTHTPTGEVTYLHPCIDYYRGALFMDRGGYRQLVKNMEERRPTNDEVTSMNQYFGIHPDEDLYIQEIGQLACVAPLPDGWVELEDVGTGEVSYRDARTGVVLDEHPLDTYFRELRDRRRRELARRKLAALKATQAVIGMRRRSSVAAAGAASGGNGGQGQGTPDGSGAGTAGQEPGAEGEQEAKDDPRQTELQEEWRQLQDAAVHLAERLAAVQCTQPPHAGTMAGGHDASSPAPAGAAAPGAPSRPGPSISGVMATAAAPSSPRQQLVELQQQHQAQQRRAGQAAGAAPGPTAPAPDGTLRRPSTPTTRWSASRGGSGSSVGGGAGEGPAAQVGASGSGQAHPSSATGPSRMGRVTSNNDAQQHQPGAGGGAPPLAPGVALGGPLLSAEQLEEVARVAAAGAGACTGLNPSFEPAGPSDDEALYGKASRTLQGCRATVKAAARLLELLPSDAPAVLASLPQGWLEVLRQVPHSWAEKLRLAAWPQLVGRLPDDWVERLGAEQQQPAPSVLAALPAGLQDLPPATLAAVGDLVCALGAAGGRSGETAQGASPADGSGGTERLQRLLSELVAPCPGGSSASRMGALLPDVVARLLRLDPACLEALSRLDPAATRGADAAALGSALSRLSPRALALLGRLDEAALRRLDQMDPAADAPSLSVLLATLEPGALRNLGEALGAPQGAAVPGLSRPEAGPGGTTMAAGPDQGGITLGAVQSESWPAHADARMGAGAPAQGGEAAAPAEAVASPQSGSVAQLAVLESPRITTTASPASSTLLSQQASPQPNKGKSSGRGQMSQGGPPPADTAGRDTNVAVEAEGPSALPASGSVADADGASKLAAGDATGGSCGSASGEDGSKDGTNLAGTVTSAATASSRNGGAASAVTAGLSPAAVVLTNTAAPQDTGRGEGGGAQAKAANRAPGAGGQSKGSSPRPQGARRGAAPLPPGSIPVLGAVAAARIGGMEGRVLGALLAAPEGALRAVAALDRVTLDRLAALPPGLLAALLAVPEGALQCLCDCGLEAQVRLGALDGSAVVGPLLAAAPRAALQQLAALDATSTHRFGTLPPALLPSLLRAPADALSAFASLDRDTQSRLAALLQHNSDALLPLLAALPPAALASLSSLAREHPDALAGLLGLGPDALARVLDAVGCGVLAVLGAMEPGAMARLAAADPAALSGLLARLSPEALKRLAALDGAAAAVLSGLEPQALAALLTTLPGPLVSGLAAMGRPALAALVAADTGDLGRLLTALPPGGLSALAAIDPAALAALTGLPQTLLAKLPSVPAASLAWLADAAPDLLQALGAEGALSAEEHRRLMSLPGPLLASLLRLPLASLRNWLELPQHALVRLAGMEAGVVSSLAAMDAEALQGVAALPRDALQVLARLPPDFLDVVRCLPPDWTERLCYKDWPRLAQQLPTGGGGWPAALAALPPEWHHVANKLPSSWPATLHVARWPELMPFLTPDWPERLASLPPQWPELVKGLPPSWPEDFRAFVERRTAVGGAQQRATQTDGDAVGSALPPVHSPRARLRSTGVQVEAPGALAAAAAATACEAQVQAKALAQKPGSLGFSLDSLVPLSLLSECSELLPAELSAGADAVAIVQQPSRPNFDARPPNPEIKRRVLAMKDRDLKSSPCEVYGEAPDELRYGSYRDSDVKHLKQRIVRAEMARSQMGAKLHQYSRLYQQQLAALSAQLEEAQRDSYELKGQLESCRRELASCVSRLEAAAGAHTELALLAALPEVPSELRSRLSVLYSTASAALHASTPQLPHYKGHAAAGRALMSRGGGQAARVSPTRGGTSAAASPGEHTVGGLAYARALVGGSVGTVRLADGSDAPTGSGSGSSTGSPGPVRKGGQEGGGAARQPYQLPPLSQVVHSMASRPGSIGSSHDSGRTSSGGGSAAHSTSGAAGLRLPASDHMLSRAGRAASEAAARAASTSAAASVADPESPDKAHAFYPSAIGHSSPARSEGSVSSAPPGIAPDRMPGNGLHSTQHAKEVGEQMKGRSTLPAGGAAPSTSPAVSVVSRAGGVGTLALDVQPPNL